MSSVGSPIRQCRDWTLCRYLAADHRHRDIIPSVSDDRCRDFALEKEQTRQKFCFPAALLLPQHQHFSSELLCQAFYLPTIASAFISSYTLRSFVRRLLLTFLWSASHPFILDHMASSLRCFSSSSLAASTASTHVINLRLNKDLRCSDTEFGHIRGRPSSDYS
jgi:hypothetical protein